MLEHHQKKKIYKNLCGVDESGCGTLTGSVFASALILPSDYYNKDLNDSKKMTAKKRKLVYDDIIRNAISYSIKSISAEEVDSINILQARLKAMDIAIKELETDYIIVDGNRFYNEYDIKNETIVKGDGKYYNIAGASVLAKVSKDNEMLKLHEEYNMYGWDTNKGYGTKKHIQAIREYGLTSYHRKTFKVKNLN